MDAIRGEGGEERPQPGTRWARGEKRRERLTLQIVVAKGHMLGVGLEKKIERVDDRHFGDEIHREREDGRLFRKRQAGEEVALRILLPSNWLSLLVRFGLAHPDNLASRLRQRQVGAEKSVAAADLKNPAR